MVLTWSIPEKSGAIKKGCPGIPFFVLTVWY